MLEAGANINEPDYRGWTPLMIACHHGHTNIVKLLLRKDADISMIDCFGKKAIDRCTKKDIINLLKNHQPRAQIEEKEKKSSLNEKQKASQRNEQFSESLIKNTWRKSPRTAADN
mmetsp:Transcript_30595/g.27790  ORF Transcript_30595/g.27790 Transcript_30595/m.27790 type:complete len:115 (+) Transcript_30595:185-529(+)